MISIVLNPILVVGTLAPEARQNSSPLIFAPTPATIDACWSCSSWSSAHLRWRSAAIGN
jgi:hypothetical protein